METKGKGLKLIYIYVCIYKSEQVLYKQSKTKILPPPPRIHTISDAYNGQMQL